MAISPRLVPLLEQFDFARKRLAERLAGPEVDSGSGVRVEVALMTNDEYLGNRCRTAGRSAPGRSDPAQSEEQEYAASPGCDR
jgi:hypothetical protein